ncbi:hypothetical protein EV177_008222 [Coemansia sp. RSA 1804]|nr:hypothetical protein EV177_008222 [Coemansia sp. RSA 1804]
MRYYSILDAAPSSVSSTAVSLAGSLLSVLGTAFVILNLYILRRNSGKKARTGIVKRQWSSRHYLIFTLTAVNFVASLTALLSGGMYLVYGRIPSGAGCTASGMFEYWAQQAGGTCIVFIALVVYASKMNSSGRSAGSPKNASTTRITTTRHWVQHNRAPVVGIIFLLPLVVTVIAQIIWRFRSEELPYCWVPRMPVYARWVAIDGWRFALVIALSVMYVRIVYVRMTSIRRPEPPTETTAFAAIESAPSIATERSAGGGGGLWGQSVHNIHRWAMSMLGRSNANEEVTAKHINGNNSSTNAANRGWNKSRSRYHDSSTKKRPRGYYEQFKRSLISLIVRHFVITTDIPSPTLSHGIFDNICKSSTNPQFGARPGGANIHEDSGFLSASATQFGGGSGDDACCCCCQGVSDAARESQNYDDGRPIEVSERQDMQQGGGSGSVAAGSVSLLSAAAHNGLRRWYSSVSRILGSRAHRRNRFSGIFIHPAASAPECTLRRSHTAPILSVRQMNLCDCAFGRPRSPGRAYTSDIRQSAHFAPPNDVVRSTTHTLTTGAALYPEPPQSTMTRYAVESTISNYAYGMDIAGTGSSAGDAMCAVDPVPVMFHKHGTAGFYGPRNRQTQTETLYAPQQLSIYTFREAAEENDHMAQDLPHIQQQEQHQQHYDNTASAADLSLHQRSCSVYSNNPSAQMVLSSLEEGSWMAAVEKCRSSRSHATAAGTAASAVFAATREGTVSVNTVAASTSGNTGISRLYVYPLAYMALWLPSLVCCVVSTYVYHRAFESPDGVLGSSAAQHAKRSFVGLAELPAHWTAGQNMHRAWPYYVAATHGVSGSTQLSWLVIVQALHMLGGFVNAVLFWLTEYFMA